MTSRLRRLFLIALAGLFPGSGAGADEFKPIRHSVVATNPVEDIRAAWIAGETDRYRHFVLGDRFEGSRLVVRDAKGKVHTFVLPQDAVFEDREARILDLDGDGRNEVAVVVSRADVGSLLALFAIREGALVMIAETPPNGQPNRWLNPSGVGRFLGDGKNQIAIVRTPHLSGRLEIWGFEGGSLTLKATRAGYSTHRLGSRNQRLFAVLPKPGGGDLLALPTLDRRSIAVLDFSKPEPEITRIPLMGRADGRFSLKSTGKGQYAINVPLEDGGLTSINLTP